MKSKVFIEITVALVILIFTYASISKFIEYEKFIFQMKLAPIGIMKTLAPYLAWLVPCVEILIVFLLSYNRTRTIGLYSSLFLFSLFELYIGAMMLSGLHLPCTCGGLISKMSWKQHLLFNAGYITIILLSLILNKRNNKSENKSLEQDQVLSYSKG